MQTQKIEMDILGQCIHKVKILYIQIASMIKMTQ